MPSPSTTARSTKATRWARTTRRGGRCCTGRGGGPGGTVTSTRESFGWAGARGGACSSGKGGRGTRGSGGRGRCTGQGCCGCKSRASRCSTRGGSRRASRRWRGSRSSPPRPTPSGSRAATACSRARLPPRTPTPSTSSSRPTLRPAPCWLATRTARAFTETTPARL
eukprot:2523181-Rhodomonas_salina.1